MTAADLAERLRGRPAGAGRWQARCPAHDDRSPSLSIAEGADGRVLLHCWAGCATSAVLAALGLAWTNVSGAATAPADRARMRRERELRDAAEAAQRRQADSLVAAEGALWERAGRIARRMAAIEWAGAAPAYHGEAEVLASEYHAALDGSRGLEVAA